MKLTLAEPRYMKDSISIINELVTEARFKINTNGIELVAMDPANVAMVIFKLLSSAFVEYQVEKPTEISINLNNLKQVLRRAKQNDMLSMEVSEGRFVVKLKGTSTRTFSLPILDLEDREQKIPELNFPVTITTKASILSDAIEDADIIGDSVMFVAEKGTFEILAEGDLSRADIEIKEDEDTKIHIEGSSKMKAKYSIEYLKKMISGAKIADTVKVQFNKDYPLRLEFQETDKVFLSFILAPRVEND